ncbi:DUF58 domain-containing protein [Roseovarius atlanticus]|uniref:DUF58 domain-containing protein n=1 Tax=Roseovarius atlanticus TaxID=1641875 RepID=UPI001C93CCC1|nr:DUF58 domain-containing protein [Roseovarius atlanticus]MBY5986925.1 DUF58 domain-containing protein [Roseovarius atlanticus]MBY6125565.1 DUF58 domain-containing protein [Roseovarius atlanticus]MBY6149974.1 DUF58 domain-containing protein [Roseovarius atlanticus]
MTQIAPLRARSEAEAARFPALLARAEHLAGTVLLGEHGRRRAGMGDDFWQYRPVQAGDELRHIDWRRSARSDTQFLRQREWQIAQSVTLWVDGAASMRFASDDSLPQKADRARLLSLAIAILLNRAGERIGLSGADLPPRRGDAQIERLAMALGQDGPDDYGAPQTTGMLSHGRALFLSDFLGDLDPVRNALTAAADRGVRGVLYQILDPAEESFPYRGRTIFESVGGTMVHETLKASELRDRYLERLAARKDALRHLCATTGWLYGTHHTSDSAQTALLWLYNAFDGGHGR